MTTAPRALAVLTAAVGVLLVTSCATTGTAAPGPDHTSADDRTAGSTPVDSETAKRRMIAAVDDTTRRLGGTWHRESGPGPESCVLSDGTPGAHWRYLVRRDSSGDPVHDIAVLTALWEQQGMHIDRWGTDESPEIVGRDGPDTATLSLTAWPGRYSVQATSICFPGDPDQL